MEIITVTELERRLNQDANNTARGITYSFFENLSAPLQEYLKNTPVTVPPGTTPYKSFLMAEPEMSTTLDVRSSSAIRHDSLMEGSSLDPWFFIDFGLVQGRPSKIDIAHASTFEVGSYQLGVAQVGTTQFSQHKTGFTQISTLEISSAQRGLSEVSPLQVSSTEIDFVKNHLSEGNPAQVHITQVSPTQFVRTLDLHSSEVSLSESVAFQQFFSSHNPGSLNLSTLIQTNFFGGESAIDLMFEIKSLPTGQLAETQIVRFDANGHPIAGTIYIDDDANGTGWFIDSTPWDASEFGIQNTAYNYQATEGSVAYGRYDLLTTILACDPFLISQTQNFSWYTTP